MGHLEMMGTVWGRWTVIGPSKKRASDGRFYWHCRCECGTERDVCGGSLRHGKTLSCGCLTAEVVGPRAKIHFTTHGMSKTATYRSWHTMRRRCYKPKFRDFSHYGGRGIKVCDRWLNSFENFLADMGECPLGMTLERKNVHADYGPENCVWATRLTQANNTRRNRRLTYAGLTMTVAQWARHLGVPRARINARLNSLKWPAARALGEGPHDGKNSVD